MQFCSGAEHMFLSKLLPFALGYTFQPFVNAFVKFLLYMMKTF